MSEFVTDDAEALAERLHDVLEPALNGGDPYWCSTECREHYATIAAALLASGVVRPADAVRAEALEQAAEAPKIAAAAANWLRDRAARLRAGGAS